jgi:hypothetical protein
MIRCQNAQARIKLGQCPGAGAGAGAGAGSGGSWGFGTDLARSAFDVAFVMDELRSWGSPMTSSPKDYQSK